MTEQTSDQRIAHNQTNPYLWTAPAPQAKIRVFCFHEAGGTASSFSSWLDIFGAAVSVVTVQLPGHGNRFAEPAIADRDQLFHELNKHLGPELNAPYVLYGQCMGAIVAYGLACLRKRNGETVPECLLVGGAKAPPCDPWLLDILGLPEDEFTEIFVESGTFSREVANRPEWRDPVLALARSDTQLFADYHPEPLPIPIHAFVGDVDTFVSLQDIQRWGPLTTTEFTVHTVPGGHLFSRNPPREFIDEVTRVLDEYTRTTA